MDVCEHCFNLKFGSGALQSKLEQPIILVYYCYFTTVQHSYILYFAPNQAHMPLSNNEHL